MRKHYETDFINMLRKSFIYHDMRSSYWYKIPDDRQFKKPYDIIAGFKGIPMVIEAKVHKKEKAWPLGKVELHQRDGLLKARKGGFQSYVFLHVKTCEHNVCITIPIVRLFYWIDAGMKSVKVVDLLKEPCFNRVKVEKLGEYIWDISTWSPISN